MSAKKKAVKKKTVSAPFRTGQRVKVLAGDFGNARGTVVDKKTADGYVGVVLDNNVRAGAWDFLASNLEALNPLPARR